MRKPFGILAETAKGNHGYFLTGTGGMLQAMLYGFGGLDVNAAGIKQLKTSLPKQWKSIKITGVGTDKRSYWVNN